MTRVTTTLGSGNPSTLGKAVTRKVPRITMTTADEEQQVMENTRGDDDHNSQPSGTHSGTRMVTNDSHDNHLSSSDEEHSNPLQGDKVNHVHAHMSLEYIYWSRNNVHLKEQHERRRNILKNDDFSRESNVTFIVTHPREEQHDNYFDSTNGMMKLIDENNIVLNESSQLLYDDKMKRPVVARNVRERKKREIVDVNVDKNYSRISSLFARATSPPPPPLLLQEEDRNHQLKPLQPLHQMLLKRKEENIYRVEIEKVTGNSNKRAKKTSRSKSNTSKANLIFILTDDQDVELGKYAHTHKKYIYSRCH